MPIPPAAEKLLPQREVAAFHHWWPIFEDSVYDWERAKAENTVKQNAKTLDRIDEELDKYGYSSLVAEHRMSVHQRIIAAHERIQDLENAQDEIAYRLSWLDWYKSLSYDKMQEEIKRLEERDWNWMDLLAFVVKGR